MYYQDQDDPLQGSESIQSKVVRSIASDSGKYVPTDEEPPMQRITKALEVVTLLKNDTRLFD